jgi:hypothetical protein
MNQIKNNAIKYKNQLLTLFVIGLLGYTAYQISLLGGVQADPAYYKEQQNKSSVVRLRNNEKTLNAIRDLKAPDGTQIPINLGKNNPFAF